jgi:hypothetical protein
VTVYFIQKYRYQTAKKRLEVITPLLLRFLFQSKRIFNWFYSNDLEKTAKSDHESIVQNGSSSNQGLLSLQLNQILRIDSIPI